MHCGRNDFAKIQDQEESGFGILSRLPGISNPSSAALF
jgi:hypothetical protein